MALYSPCDGEIGQGTWLNPAPPHFNAPSLLLLTPAAAPRLQLFGRRDGPCVVRCHVAVRGGLHVPVT